MNRRETNDTNLMYAARIGNVNALQTAIHSNPATVNEQTEYGITALHIAAERGQIAVVEALLDRGADTSKRNFNDQTALHIAAERGHMQIVEALVSHGADVNALDVAHKTALQIATEYGQADIATYLLKHGADPNLCDGEGKAALHAAVLDSRLNIVEILLTHGADVNGVACTSPRSAPPLYHAVHTAQPDIARMLIARGADANAVSGIGFTPLHAAVTNNDLESVQALVEDGRADVNKPSNRGWTPLYTAARSGYGELVTYLLAHGATVNRGIVRAAAPVLKPMLEALYVEHAPKWGGFTKSDMTKLNAVFESPLDFSACPICLKYVERSEACNYMSHNCSLSGYYHPDLYAKYKNPAGTVYWCTQCGRICSGHKHYALSPALGPKPPLLPSRDPFAADCRVDGGGGVEEKVMRFRAMRQTAVELQSRVGVMPHEDAMTALVEAMWMPAAGAEAQSIMRAKEYNVPLNAFPGNTASVVAPGRKAPEGVYESPEILTGVENAFTYESDAPVIRFKHKDAAGVMRVHAGALSKASVLDYIRRSGGKKANRCFECSGYLWPEEIAAAFADPAIAPSVTEQDRAALAAYKERFYRDYNGKGGRRRKTRRSDRKRA